MITMTEDPDRPGVAMLSMYVGEPLVLVTEVDPSLNEATAALATALDGCEWDSVLRADPDAIGPPLATLETSQTFEGEVLVITHTLEDTSEVMGANNTYYVDARVASGPSVDLVLWGGTSVDVLAAVTR